MKKFYCFTAGQIVPKWVVDYVCDKPESCFNNRKSSMRFIVSCIGIRDGKHQVKLLRMKNDKTPDVFHDYIKVTNMSDATIGGVGQGRGIFICGKDHQHVFGKGLHYSHSVVNGKEVLIQPKGLEDVTIQGNK